MKKLLQLMFLVLILDSCDLLADESKKIEGLAWLQGCWSGEGKDRSYTEQWMKPAAQTMIGMSRTIVKDKTVAYEFLLIRQEANGDIVLIAKPSGQKEATFKMTKLADREVVFENPDHDFPQRISYRSPETGVLNAQIDGQLNGKTRSIDFPMKKAACE
jgi:hypothetical protein